MEKTIIGIFAIIRLDGGVSWFPGEIQENCRLFPEYFLRSAVVYTLSKKEKYG